MNKLLTAHDLARPDPIASIEIIETVWVFIKMNGTAIFNPVPPVHPVKNNSKDFPRPSVRQVKRNSQGFRYGCLQPAWAPGFNGLLR